jgi:hypothetical protein
MEAVLDLYAEEVDPLRPVVGFDETTKQLIEEVREPIAATVKGAPEKFDYEYRRNGTRDLLMMVAPRLGWRHVAVTERHTKREFAEQMKWLVDEAFPEAELIRVVLDNLKTHTRGALYERFEAAQAHRILQKLEFHYTPKHGSWLNVAEIELSIFARQCLARRIGDEESLKKEVKKLEDERNAAAAKINWRFTAQEAREKLHRLYPSNLD